MFSVRAEEIFAHRSFRVIRNVTVTFQALRHSLFVHATTEICTVQFFFHDGTLPDFLYIRGNRQAFYRTALA